MNHLFRYTLVFLLAGSASAYPPVPKSDPNNIKGWGLFVDPDKDCSIKEEGGVLSIGIPGKSHDLLRRGDNVKLNAPRVLRTVAGDFTLEVKIPEYTVPKSAESNDNTVASQVGAGLVIWKDEKNFIRLQQRTLVNRNRYSILLSTYLDTADNPNRGIATAKNVNELGCQLRISRSGKKLTFEMKSPIDSQDWTPIERPNTELEGEVQIGVHAGNTSSEPFIAKFENLKLEEKK